MVSKFNACSPWFIFCRWNAIREILNGIFFFCWFFGVSSFVSGIEMQRFQRTRNKPWRYPFVKSFAAMCVMWCFRVDMSWMKCSPVQKLQVLDTCWNHESYPSGYSWSCYWLSLLSIKGSGGYRTLVAILCCLRTTRPAAQRTPQPKARLEQIRASHFRLLSVARSQSRRPGTETGEGQEGSSAEFFFAAGPWQCRAVLHSLRPALQPGCAVACCLATSFSSCCACGF